MPLGWSEMIFIALAALLIFGPKKLPELGKSLGKGLREFKKATNDLKSNWEEHIRDVETPVHEFKESIHEIKADVIGSTTIPEELPSHETLPEETPTSIPEETKPDARPN